MISESKGLKLTARNIKSTLVKSNKELENLSAKDDNLNLIDERNRKRRRKERKLESSSLIKAKGRAGLGMLGKSVQSLGDLGPKDIFDKVIQFAGIMLVGKAVIEVPKIVETQGGITNTFTPIIESLKGGLNAIGDGIQGVTKNLKGDKDIKDIKEKVGDNVASIKKDLNFGEAEKLIKEIHQDAKNLEKSVGDHGVSDKEIDEFIKDNENNKPKPQDKKGDKDKVSPNNTGNVIVPDASKEKVKVEPPKKVDNKIDPIAVLEKNKHLIPDNPFLNIYQMVLNEIKKDPTKYDTKEEIEAALQQFNIDPSKVRYKDGGLISGPSHKKGGRWINVEGGEVMMSNKAGDFWGRKNLVDMNSIKPIEKKYNIEGQTVSGGAVKTIIVTQRVIVPS